MVVLFDEIDFSDYAERHAFNDIYETLLRGLQKNNGEFYTPRAITSFVVDKVDPKIGATITYWNDWCIIILCQFPFFLFIIKNLQKQYPYNLG